MPDSPVTDEQGRRWTLTMWTVEVGKDLSGMSVVQDQMRAIGSEVIEPVEVLSLAEHESVVRELQAARENDGWEHLGELAGMTKRAENAEAELERLRPIAEAAEEAMDALGFAESGGQNYWRTARQAYDVLRPALEAAAGPHSHEQGS